MGYFLGFCLILIMINQNSKMNKMIAASKKQEKSISELKQSMDQLQGIEKGKQKVENITSSVVSEKTQNINSQQEIINHAVEQINLPLMNSTITNEPESNIINEAPDLQVIENNTQPIMNIESPQIIPQIAIEPIENKKEPLPEKEVAPKNQIFSLESIISKLGILLFLVGTGFLFKYIYQIGFITEEVTVISGLVVGFTFIILGQMITKKGRIILSQVLFGGGIAILYTCIYAAYSFYGFLSYTFALPAMIVITLFAYFLASWKDNLSLGIVAFSGGMFTPFLLYTGDNNYTGLLLYICILLTGTYGVVILKKWKILLYVGSTSSMLVLLGVDVISAVVQRTQVEYLLTWYFAIILLGLPLLFLKEWHMKQFASYCALFPLGTSVLLVLNSPSTAYDKITFGILGTLCIVAYFIIYNYSKTIPTLIHLSYGIVFLWIDIIMLKLDIFTIVAVIILAGIMLLTSNYYERRHLEIASIALLAVGLIHFMVDISKIDFLTGESYYEILILTITVAIAIRLSIRLKGIVKTIALFFYDGFCVSYLIMLWVYTYTQQWNFVVLAIVVQQLIHLVITKYHPVYSKYWAHLICALFALLKIVGYIFEYWEGYSTWELFTIDLACLVIIWFSIFWTEKKILTRTFYYIGIYGVSLATSWMMLSKIEYRIETFLCLVAISLALISYSEFKNLLNRKYYLSLVSMILLGYLWIIFSLGNLYLHHNHFWMIVTESVILAAYLLVYLISNKKYLRFVVMGGLYYIVARFIFYIDLDDYSISLLLFIYTWITWGINIYEQKQLFKKNIGPIIFYIVFGSAFVFALRGLIAIDNNFMQFSIYLGSLILLFIMIEQSFKKREALLKLFLLMDVCLALFSLTLDTFNGVTYFMPACIGVLWLSKQYIISKDESKFLLYIDRMIYGFMGVFMIYCINYINTTGFNFSFLMADLLTVAGVIFVSTYVNRFKTLKYIELINYLYFMIVIYKNMPKDGMGQGLISLIWGSFSILLLIFGIIKLRKQRVYSGLVIMIVVAIKLLIIDLAYIGSLWKILLFLGFGGTLLLISYFLQPILKKDELK